MLARHEDIRYTPAETAMARKKSPTPKRPKKTVKKAPTKPAPKPVKKPTPSGIVLSPEALYAEALRRGVEAVRGAELLLAGYGQWLFANVLEGNTAAVLDGEIEHPVWTKLLDAADGATLPIGRGTLSVTLRVAALDKRLADAAWSALTYTLKTELLPLGDPKLMRSAARHVLAGGLSVREARKYVLSQLHPEGTIVRLTPVKARSAIKRLSAQFASPKYAGKLLTSLNKLNDDDLDDAREALLKVAEQLQELAKSLRETEEK